MKVKEVIEALEHCSLGTKSISDAVKLLKKYREVCGDLVVHDDGTVSCILVGKEIEYIPKDLHRTFCRLAESSAEDRAYKRFAEKLKEQASLGDYPWDEERVYTVQIDWVLEDLMKEKAGFLSSKQSDSPGLKYLSEKDGE